MRVKEVISGLIGAAVVAVFTTAALTGCVVEPSGIAYVRVAPPPPESEVIGVAPGGGYIWIAGHHAWMGDAYVWVPGRWEFPPREHARWEPGRWHRNEHGWYWVTGRWIEG